MRIISYNVNGIRAASRKGFYDWLRYQRADIVCLQETKAQCAQLEDPNFHPSAYHCYYVEAEKKGYSGVGLYSRVEPDRVLTQLDFALSDSEGRYIQADFGNLSVISLYLPSGSSGDERQALKYEFMDFYGERLQAQHRDKRQYIICGDWNIAHKKIDIKNWRGNQKNSGFLPEERAWLDEVFGDYGYVDAFREVNQAEDEYTWWSNRGNARANNVGWRIDYHVVSENLRDTVRAAKVYKEKWFSDHAPLIIDYDMTL